MMKKGLLGVVLALGAMSAAMAEDMPMRGMPDKDMTRAEFLQRAGEHFDRMDANKDGKVTVAERRAFRQQMRQQRGERGGPGMQRMQRPASAPASR